MAIMRPPMATARPTTMTTTTTIMDMDTATVAWPWVSMSFGIDVFTGATRNGQPSMSAPAMVVLATLQSAPPARAKDQPCEARDPVKVAAVPPARVAAAAAA